MRLGSLTTDPTRLRGDPLTLVLGLTADSRAVRPGDLFAALAGGRADGFAFVGAAVAAGAVAVLGDARLSALEAGVPVVVADEPRRELALMAARLHAPAPATVVAVTGTNGKSSVVAFTRQIWAALGHAAASLGTLGLVAPGLARATGLTTQDPVSLHRTLAELAASGIDRVALEASSHALDQFRLDGLQLRAAAFTQLSRDHLDYHGTMAAYLAAKARLFAELLPADATAVLNADVPEAATLRAVARARGQEVLDYGRQARRLRLDGVRPTPHGQAVALTLDGQPGTFTTPLVGAFQVMNLLAAAGLAIGSGADAPAVLAVLAGVQAVRGRLERVATTPAGATVYVDYAHSPDALATVLTALRPHTSGRLAVVFGAGGDRDPGKRALMGAAAAAAADRVYVTDDNPRSEDPAAIRRAVLAECPGGIDAGERRAALDRALGELGRGDLLLVAGKGHEATQTVGSRILPFDDALVVAELLQSRARHVAA